MTLYRIAKWNDYFETHETRKLTRLAWIPVPNKHDGLGFRSISAQKDSAALFGAWNLLIQVASKATREHRGKLERDGIPLDAAAISVMTGFQEKVIARAFEFFSQPSIGWLVKEDSQTNLPLPPENLPASPGNHPDEWKGREEREGNGKKGIEGKVRAAVAAPLSLEDFKTNPAYEGINVEIEFSKMATWCKANKRMPSERRFVNWLNRIDRPMASGKREMPAEFNRF